VVRSLVDGFYRVFWFSEIDTPVVVKHLSRVSGLGGIAIDREPVFIYSITIFRRFPLHLVSCTTHAMYPGRTTLQTGCFDVESSPLAGLFSLAL
jgi:hypothetical protein